MYSKVYWLLQLPNNGRIGIMARPRGGDWLEGEILNLKKQKVDLIVSLLDQNEVTELELHNESTIAVQNEIEFINFSIPDRSIPKNDQLISSLIENLLTAIQKGKAIVIHCRMGIGRSSIVAGALLLKLGLKPNAILDHISKIRGLKVPDTKEQEEWLKNQC